jgi:hypothetical protein
MKAQSSRRKMSQMPFSREPSFSLGFSKDRILSHTIVAKNERGSNMKYRTFALPKDTLAPGASAGVETMWRAAPGTFMLLSG